MAVKGLARLGPVMQLAWLPEDFDAALEHWTKTMGVGPFFIMENIALADMRYMGEPTNAVFGFVKALRKMLSDLKPDLAAVVWDAGLPERRMELLPSYKQQREETPDDPSSATQVQYANWLSDLDSSNRSW